MFCSNCGRNHGEKTVNFCPGCGAKTAAAVNPLRPTIQVNQPASINPAPYYQSTINIAPPQPAAPKPPAAPGQTLLKVTGVLHTIFASFTILNILFVILTIDTWIWTFPGDREMWYVYYGLASISGLYTLFIGIMAIRNCKDTSKGSMLLSFGIIDVLAVFAIAIFGTVTELLSGWFGAVVWIAMPFGLIVPILYIAGALKNRNAYNRNTDSEIRDIHMRLN